MKKLLSLVIIVVGIVADQIFKNWIVANIQLGDTEKIWPNVLSLTYIKNDGAAWSSFSGQQWFFLILTPIDVYKRQIQYIMHKIFLISQEQTLLCVQLSLIYQASIFHMRI